MFAMSGLSPLEALRAATLGGAETMGFASDLASIEAGKLADLVVLNRNPLENIRVTTDIRYVMKNGVLLDGETLDQLWPEKKRFPLFYWHRQDEELRRRRPPSPTP
jgi:cytosine/adenosine deaminase-related metal-dependent hydrolase